MKTTNMCAVAVLVALAGLCGFAKPAFDPPETALGRVRALKLPQIAFTEVKWHAADEKDADGKPAVFAGLGEVRFTAKPSYLSHIRCVVALPPPEKWDGRFQALGTIGAGGHENLKGPADRARGTGSATGYTDLGTSQGIRSNDVLIDYGRRATHVLATTSKRIIEAFYGRPPARSYYEGISTGGQQGVAAAQFHPDDFDGIVAYVPAMDRVALHIYLAWCARQLVDANGKVVFTDAQLRAIEQGGIDWFADKDEPYARGRFVTDSRWTPEAEAGVIACAIRREPSLDDPDLLRRMRNLFRGPTVDGRNVFPGLPFGSRIKYGWGIPSVANSFLLNWYGRTVTGFTDEDMDLWLRNWGPSLDAMRTDLSAFRARGGKMVIIGGMADSIIPCGTMADWYEDTARVMGGMEKLSACCRLYLVPGRDHCGEVTGIAHVGVDIRAWVEKGIDPGVIRGGVRNGEKDERVPVQPYPFFTTGSAATGWGVKPFPRRRACENALAFAPPFGDGMVVQRETPIRVWGRAPAGETVEVAFGAEAQRTKTDAKGNWKVEFAPRPASKTGCDLVAKLPSFGETRTVRGVLVGEVWFCSGQSNAQCPLWGGMMRYRDLKGGLAARLQRRPLVRFATTPGVWRPCEPRHVLASTGVDRDWICGAGGRENHCSALGFHYGVELFDALGGEVPVGVIGAYTGSTPARTWIPGVPDDPDTPQRYDAHVLWNRWVAPWTPFALRGFVWYLGESDASGGARAPAYCAELKHLHDGWRKAFANPHLKFNAVEISAVDGSYANLQKAQALYALSDPDAGLAACNDLASKDVHGTDKETAARRLVLLALRDVYGRKDLPADPPRATGWEVVGKGTTNAICRVTVANGKGLYLYNEAADDDTVCLDVKGADGVWHPARLVNMNTGANFAHGAIGGARLDVLAPGIVDPQGVRYLHRAPSRGNVYNDVALPLLPFSFEAKSNNCN